MTPEDKTKIVSEYRIPYWEPDEDSRHLYVLVKRGPADLSDFWGVIEGDRAWAGPDQGLTFQLVGDARFRYPEDEAILIAQNLAITLNHYKIKEMEQKFPGFQYRGSKYDMNRKRQT